MERREFLKAGAVAGAAVATTGCATTGARAPSLEAASMPPITSDETALLTERIDGTLAAMERASLVHEIIPSDLPIPRDDAAELAAVERLLQDGVRSLYVSGVYLDQAEAMRAQPALQQRVLDTLPAMDATVSQSTAVLASLTQAEQATFQKTLREHPELGMRVAEVLDRRARELGISSRRRMQMRLAAAQISTRMRNQHPAAVAEEYLHKTNKAYVRHGGGELVRKVAARAGEEMFWAPMVAAAGSAAASEPPLAPYAPPPAGPVQAAPYPPTGLTPARIVNGPPGYAPPPGYVMPPPQAAPTGKPGSRALSAAGWMFGIGVGSFLAGLIIVEAGAFPGVFLMTLGVILFFAAVITALVGLIIRAAN